MPTEILTRSAPLVPSTFRRDGAVAYVDATITTGAEVRRSFGAERLTLTREAVTLPESVPLRDNHRSGSIRDILGQATGFRFEPGAIVATLEIRDAAAADLVERAAVDAVSIGYVPTAWKDTREGTRLVRTQTAWALREVSLTDKPAESGATIRSNGMEPTPEQIPAPEATPTPAPIIRAHVAPTGSEDPAAAYALREEALYCRMAGAEPSAGARQFMGFGFAEFGHDALVRSGDTGLGVMSREGVLHRAMHGTSDFPNLLTGAGNRTLRAAYDVAASPLKALAQRVMANDFRANDILAIGGMGTLAEVTEHGEITAATTAEAKESWQLRTFGKTFGLTRRAVINDDLSAFGRVTSELGRAAAETENSALAALLLANPAMSDGVALFHASHGNLAASPVAIGEASVSAARLAMRSQTGITGERISVTPKYLVVGPEIETEAEKFLTTINATTADDVNPFAGKLTLAVEPRISGDDWYIFASPSEAPVLLFGHLASAPGPQISSREGWEVLGREFRVVLDFAVAATDWRGAYRNAGA